MSHPDLGYSFLPICKGVMRDPTGKVWPFTTNEMGLPEEPEYSLKPGPGVLRVLVLGPSNLVNMSSKVGTVPSMRAEIGKKWVRLGKFRKVELINGSMPGYDIVQSYLILERLLDRYNPHVVVFQSSLEAFALQQANDHFSSVEFDGRGISSRMGPQQHFWPLPISYSPAIWEKLGPAKGPIVSARLQGVRLAMYKLLISLGFGRYRSKSDLSVYGEIHLGYLQAMKELAEKYKSKFFVIARRSPLNVEVQFWDMLKMNAWYKPEWYAAKLLRWPHLKNQDFQKVTDAIYAGFNTVAQADARLGEADRFNLDYHPNELGVQKVGAIWGEALRIKLREEFDPKKIN